MNTRSLPVVLASSVVRSAHKGESHGGLYRVDLQQQRYEKVIDWNDASINWEGRGMDRGLRGLAFYRDSIIVAASNEIFVYDRDFRRLTSFTSPYLLHCHEICLHEDTLFVTSTGFDAVLALDMRSAQFRQGWCIRHDAQANRLRVSVFNPSLPGGPSAADTVHINNVFHDGSHLFISALRITNLLQLGAQGISAYAPIPAGTHNARPFGAHVLVNDTEHDRILIQDRQGHPLQAFPVPHYAAQDLLMTDLPQDHARQGFARGLAVTDDGLLIGGSSPSTVSVYRPGAPDPVVSINLTMDVRNAIHGLEIWPW